MAVRAVATVHPRYQAQRRRPRRINVLSEMPEEWRECLERWSKLNEPHRRQVEDDGPDANEEYLLYQTLIGAWPLDPCSAEDQRSSSSGSRPTCRRPSTRPRCTRAGSTPTPDYDQAVQEYVRLHPRRASQPAVSGRFPRVPAHESATMVCSIRCRRPCSSSPRRACRTPTRGPRCGISAWSIRTIAGRWTTAIGGHCLQQIQTAIAAAGSDLRDLCRELFAAREDGRIKLFVHHRVLGLRRSHPGLFGAGNYTPLTSSGPKADHIFAFFRHHDDVRALVAVPRLWTRLLAGPDQTPLGGTSVAGHAARGSWRTFGSGMDKHLHRRATGSDRARRRARLSERPSYSPISRSPCW